MSASTLEMCRSQYLCILNRVFLWWKLIFVKNLNGVILQITAEKRNYNNVLTRTILKGKMMTMLNFLRELICV